MVSHLSPLDFALVLLETLESVETPREISWLLLFLWWFSLRPSPFTDSLLLLSSPHHEHRALKKKACRPPPNKPLIHNWRRKKSKWTDRQIPKERHHLLQHPNKQTKVSLARLKELTVSVWNRTTRSSKKLYDDRREVSNDCSWVCWSMVLSNTKVDYS